jgi:hypothetical protein
MTKFLLIVHVLAAIVAVGPVTVAASAFRSRRLRQARHVDGRVQSAVGDRDRPDDRATRIHDGGMIRGLLPDGS